MSTLVLGNDAAWGGWGRCFASAAGPIRATHVKLSGRRWRWTAMHDELELLRVSADTLARERQDSGILMVVEKPPMHYKAASRGKKANEAVVGYGLGQITAPLLLGSVAWGWSYPWEVDTADWRGWWSIGGLRGGRIAYKLAALTVVHRHGWADHLTPFGWTPEKMRRPADAVALAEGPCGDVAEAMLIAVGAAMRLDLAPKGPSNVNERCQRERLP